VSKDHERKNRSEHPAASVADRTTAQPAAAEPASEVEAILDRCARILAANGAAPQLLEEVQAMQANLTNGEVNEDIVILLLEAAITHHIPDIAEDEREWAKELVKLAGI
jgi:hypothetical protein